MNAPLLVMTRQNPWEGFSEGAWRTEVNVRDFINQNYTPYVGDDTVLAGATTRTKAMWETVAELLKKEQANGGLRVRATHGGRAVTLKAPKGGDLRGVAEALYRK